MSDPDQLAKLKATVELYEKEIKDELVHQQENLDLSEKTNSSVAHLLMVEGMTRILSLDDKLVVAYREYSQALEKLVPR